MNERKKEEWIRGPKAKQQGAPWRETEELIKKQKLKSSAPGRMEEDMVPGISERKKPPLPVNSFWGPTEPSFVPDEEFNYLKPSGSKLFLPPVTAGKLSLSLDLDIDDIPEDITEKAIFNKFLSKVPSEEEESSFEYYEKVEEEEDEEFMEDEEITEEETPSRGVRYYLEKMLSYSPSDHLTELMFRELEALGEVLISECQEFGIGLIIFEKYRNLTEIKINDVHPFPPGTKVRDGRGWEIVRGAYNPQHKMMFMAEELITGIPGGVTIHEFGHAYDHAWMATNEMQFPFSVFLWNKFYHEGMFISEYASTQPKEYFAESLEAYFNPKKKDILKKCDPRMYGFIGNIIAGVHKRKIGDIRES
jgi:hypothetical protein